MFWDKTRFKHLPLLSQEFQPDARLQEPPIFSFRLIHLNSLKWDWAAFGLGEEYFSIVSYFRYSRHERANRRGSVIERISFHLFYFILLEPYCYTMLSSRGFVMITSYCTAMERD